MRALLRCCLLLCLAAACSREPHARGPVLRDVPVARVLRVPIELEGSARLQLRTRTSGGAPRPVLHLWDVQAAREVARASAGWLSGEAELTHHAAAGATHAYLALVRAGGRGEGTVELLRDGESLGSASVGGTPLPLAAGPGERVLLARTPGGAHAASLHALGDGGALLALDDGSGRIDTPALDHTPGARALLVAGRDGASGAVSLYVNDADDRDGDGLGNALERALGSCDGIEQPGCGDGPLGDYYREVGNTRDSDRDGLRDDEEVLGRHRGAGVDLPRFGASPVHKDLFVEVDHHRSLPGHRLAERDLLALARLFGAGDASDLRNPDGRDGVALHLDVGRAPGDPRHAALFGDWGGSDAVPGRDQRAMRKRHMAKERRGIFRYALAVRTGVGQAGGGALVFNANRERMRTLGHELGHLVGLEHHGTRAWGTANCKLPYRSIMNYVYQNDHRVGFSTQPQASMNPMQVFEAGALGARDPLELLMPPLELETIGDGIDYNRDGMISTAPVRAPLTWATYKSCDAAGHGRRVLSEGEAAPVTPALASLGPRLHALFVATDGRVLWSSGSADGRDGWPAPRAIEGLAGVRAIAATALDGARLGLATVGEGGAVALHELREVDGALRPERARVLPDADAVGEPSLAALRGTAHLHFRDAQGRLMEIIVAGDAELRARPALDDAGRGIVLGASPSAAWLGTGELCGVFPDAERFMRFHCLDAQGRRWKDLSARAFYAGLGPRTRGRVSIAYHRHRESAGTTVTRDASRGAVYLAFTRRNSGNEPDNPSLLISRWLGRGAGASARARIDFRWRGRLLTEWTNLPARAGLALHGGPQLPGLQALLPEQHRRGGPVKLSLLPHADGTYDAELGTGNDFRVMERGICMGLWNRERCGSARTAAY